MDRDYLQREYVERQRSAADIAREVGCSDSTVYRALVQAGIAVRSRGEATRLWRGSAPLDEEAVIAAYRAGASSNDIAKRFRSSKTTVFDILRRHGVARRSKSEANRWRRDTRARRSLPLAALRGLSGACALCGETERLEVHHINGRRDDDSPDNLIQFCWEHHVLVESLIRKALIGGAISASTP